MLAVLSLLFACRSTPPQPPPQPFPASVPKAQREPRTPPSPPLAPSAEQPKDGLVRLLLDGPTEGCKRFDVVVRDRTRTRLLLVRVDGDDLRLKAGEHDLPIDGRRVALEFSVFDTPTEPPVCRDIPVKLPPPVQRWTAKGGTVKLAWTSEPKTKGEAFPIDIDLVDVELVEDDGRTMTIDAHLDDVKVGWVPG